MSNRTLLPEGQIALMSSDCDSRKCLVVTHVYLLVIPAKAGIQCKLTNLFWIPAFAGMDEESAELSVWGHIIEEIKMWVIARRMQ